MCNHAHPSRRDFFARFTQNVLVGSSILQIAAHRAAWAQALAPAAGTDLFDIQKVADDVYFAAARPSPIVNCNAAIFVNSADVLVVDAHSKPSAAAALIAQIKRDVTPKPVRYLVDSHFHWDHSQGNAAYLATGHKVDILATKTTKQLMEQYNAARLKASLDSAGPSPISYPWVGHQLEDLRERIGKATADAEKARLQLQLQRLESFAAEMKNFTPTLPTITFDKSYVVKDKNHELHLEFHGRAHTAGDVVVLCPQKRVIATGDAILGSVLPFFGDSYPKAWPKTIADIGKLEFDHVMPGHGGVQHGHETLSGMGDYIDEITERVDAGKKAGQSITDLQQSIKFDSLKSLQSGAYADSLASWAGANKAMRMGYVQNGIKNNILEMYDKVERV
jgi:cyclase